MMTHLLPILIVLFAWSAAPASGAAAQPPEAEAAGQPPAQPPAPVDPQAPPVPPPNYTYSSEGRRDPFRSLVNTGTTDGPSGPRLRPDGVPGLAVNDVIVRGILKTPDGFIAMIQAPNGRTYTVRSGDQLFDGRVRSITAEALFIMQDVNDPLSREKQREVRKPLRGGAEG